MTYIKAYANGFLSVFIYLSGILVVCAGFFYGFNLLIIPIYVSALLGLGSPITVWINNREKL